MDLTQIDGVLFEQCADTGDQAMLAGQYTDAGISYRAALGLWRGEPFGYVADLDFARRWRRRLTSWHQNVIRGHAEALVRLGRIHAAIPSLEEGTDTYPGDGQMAQLLTVALYLAERDADAAQAAQTAVTYFGAAAGISPPENLSKLQHLVLTQQLPRDIGPALTAAGFRHPARPPARNTAAELPNSPRAN